MLEEEHNRYKDGCIAINNLEFWKEFQVIEEEYPTEIKKMSVLYEMVNEIDYLKYM